jgi:hypothetical protein
LDAPADDSFSRRRANTPRSAGTARAIQEISQVEDDKAQDDGSRGEEHLPRLAPSAVFGPIFGGPPVA